MLDEILERLDGHCAGEDRPAVRHWYNQMPIEVSRHMLRDAMAVLMHGPDADTIASACYKTRFAYDRAARLMIELGAMWYIDLHGAQLRTMPICSGTSSRRSTPTIHHRGGQDPERRLWHPPSRTARIMSAASTASSTCATTIPARSHIG